MVRMSGYDFRVNNEAWVSDDYSSYLYGNETIHMFMEHAASTDPEPDPLFILYSAQAAHIPYDAPDEYMERFSYIEDEDRQGLAAVIAVFDESLGDIVEYLKSEDSGFLWENTLMIISTDNGGTVTSGSSNFPLRLVLIFVYFAIYYILLNHFIHLLIDNIVLLQWKGAERKHCGKAVSEPLPL